MEKVYFENLIAGALLKFEKINGFDISVFIDDIKHKNILYSGELYKMLEKYVKEEDAIISLRNNCFINELLNFQGEIIKNYFNNLNMEIFVLKKLRLIGNVPRDVIETYFDGNQIDYFDYLYIKKYISIENDEFIITKLGLLELFLDENAKLFLKFKKEIEENNLSRKLLEDYLNIQEEFDDSKKIFNIEDYKIFCNKFSKKLTIEK